MSVWEGEMCPSGFDLPQSEMHLTSSNHVGPSDAVNGPTVVKKHLRNSRDTARS